MLDGIKQDCVDFKPNYDNTTEEPIFLPSRFPYILCGNNMGIAVGMSGNMVSHNFTEVSDAVKYYLDNKTTCTTADLMQFIKGPDFPTGGRVTNGEELLNIYTRGQGSIKVESHYDIIKKGTKTQIVFHDIPYGVSIDEGVKAPLKKLVLEDGYDVFENIEVLKVGSRNFDIIVSLAKNADVRKCLDILFSKTRLATTVKINQTLIVDNTPKTLSLLELIKYWVKYRSGIIKRIAEDDYKKTNHKLTVTIGLQKCMSDIDKLVSLIRNSESRASAKIIIMKEFALSDEQAEAVLDMKLSRLSRLDLTELDKTKAELEEHLAKTKEIIDNENIRFNMIKNDLNEIKKAIGKDERITEITYTRPMVGDDAAKIDAPAVKNEFRIYPEGLRSIALDGVNNIDNDICCVVSAYTSSDILVYNAAGEIGPVDKNGISNIIGATVKDAAKNKVVTVTKSGNIKVSAISEFKFSKCERAMKIKDGDALLCAGLCSDDDFVMIFNGERVLKLAVKDLSLATKLTVGSKSGMDNIQSAFVCSNKDLVLISTADGKGKFTSIQDFSIDSRGNKGQSLVEGVKWFIKFDSDGRDTFYVVPKQGKTIAVNSNKLSIKGKSAAGALITSRAIINIV